MRAQIYRFVFHIVYRYTKPHTEQDILTGGGGGVMGNKASMTVRANRDARDPPTPVKDF